MPMSKAHSPPRRTPLRSYVTFTLAGVFTSGTRTLSHRQYLSENYVLTEFEGSTVIYSPVLGGRFMVDREEQVLRRVDDSLQRLQVDHLRSVLGEVVVERSEYPCEIDGYSCRLHTLRNENGRIEVVAEAWCTRVAGAERTALHQERAFDARLHPFALPLANDEVVVRSVMTTVANGLQQRQTYRLRSLTSPIGDIEALDGLLEYPITRA